MRPTTPTAASPTDPPEEPHLRSEPAQLSPVSPKPVRFPTPTDVPVLEMQMDVRFNQTELHMLDPSVQPPAQLRPDAWTAPPEHEQAGSHVDGDGDGDDDVVMGQASPFSTGGDMAKEETAPTMPTEGAGTATGTDFPPTLSTSAVLDPTALASNDSSHDANARLDAAVEHEAISFAEPSFASSSPSVPVASSTTSAIAVAPAPAAANLLPASASEAVDMQAILDTLTPTPVGVVYAPDSSFPPDAPPDDSLVSASHSTALLSGLPPRPPPQEQPLIHPNYVHSQHIRDYHPHAAHPAFQPQHARTISAGNVADPTSRNYVPPVHSPTHPNSTGASVFAASPTSATPIALAPATATAIPTTLSEPFAANTPIESRRESKLAAGEPVTAEDRPWDADVQRKYDRFIDEERKYVSEGRWEQFPGGSRLFVGNLSSEKVTKRDIFHIFHMYGDLAQISIKQAYGFVQFLRTEDCARALEGEQGTQIRDKRIHLEVSKPQKNRAQPNQRRSRSPENGRGGRAPVNVDRYVSSNRSGQTRGSRDSYGSRYRSPSPRPAYRDRYDDRYVPRSRSPPFNNGRGSNNSGNNFRFRSPSPQERAVGRSEDDDLPLPRRAPQDVPDVQILVLDTLERDFIAWVEQAFLSRGLRADVLLLSPRLAEQAVVNRQIVEGVLAVSRLTRAAQHAAKIGLQVFNRSRDAGNVTFDEYLDLEPSICAELVLRAKGTHMQQQAQPPSSAYGSAPPPPQQYYQQQQQPFGGPPAPSNYGQYPPGPQYAQPPPQAPPTASAPVPPNLQHLITGLDSRGLQSLLAAMNPQQRQGSQNYQQQSPRNPSSGFGPPPSQQQQFAGATFAQQQEAAVAALHRDPGAFAGWLGQQQQQQMGQGQGQRSEGVQVGQQGGGGGVDMREILARLGTYKP